MFIFALFSNLFVMEAKETRKPDLFTWAQDCFQKCKVGEEIGNIGPNTTPLSKKIFIKILDEYASKMQTDTDFNKNDFWIGPDCKKATPTDPPTQEYFEISQKAPSREKDANILYYIQKETLNEKDNAEFFFQGDSHGDVLGLLINLIRLHSMKYIDENFKIIKKNFYMIFLGDYVDRGAYSSEVVYTLCRLKLAEDNWNKVFLIHGNHEERNVGAQSFLYNTSESKKDKQFQGEIYFKYDKNEKFENTNASLLKNILRWYSFLPYAVFLKKGDDVIQCCHGGVLRGFLGKALFNGKEIRIFQKIPKSVALEEFSNQFIFVANLGKVNEVVNDNYHDWDNHQVNKWNSYIHVDSKRYKNFYDVKGETINTTEGRIFFGTSGDMCTYAPSTNLKKYLTENQIKAVFRGHDHNGHVSKMYPKKEIISQEMNVATNYRKYKDYGPFEWKSVLKEEDKKALQKTGFSISNYAPVFTFSSAIEKDIELTETGFGILSASGEYKDWKMRVFETSVGEFELRKGKFLSVTTDQNQNNKLTIAFVEKSEDSGLNGDLKKKLHPQDHQEVGLQGMLVKLKKMLTALKNKLVPLQK
jgi:hypothetical protein